MGRTQREIERKYEGGVGGDALAAALARAAGVATVRRADPRRLDAVYYDTADERLAADRITLRRRTGGDDAGWHLKLPLGPDVREEIHAPLADDDGADDAEPPAELTALVRSRIRGTPLAPVVRIRSARAPFLLLAADGTPLAEAVADDVRAERLSPPHGGTHWSEYEVELAPGADPAFLDTVEHELLGAGLRRSAAPSKLRRALDETAPQPQGAPPPSPAAPGAAGGPVLAFVREQYGELVALDPAVRRDLPDAVHRMRVATRRLRAVFRAYPAILDRRVTDPLGAELRRLAAELGVGRDHEVLAERITAAVRALPAGLRHGPVEARLREWDEHGHAEARDRLTAVLDGHRHLALLGALDDLLAAPPLRNAAQRPPEEVLTAALRRAERKVDRRLRRALDAGPGPAGDRALHATRKAAKRLRYAAEAAAPALGKPARRTAKRAKSLQKPLGEHQDSVMARAALLDLAEAAARAGEPTFTYGVLHEREARRADACRERLPGAR